MYDVFDLKNNGTSVAAEIAAGTTTFLASMYIILVNPAILSQAGLPSAAVLTSTVLVSAFCSILMGLGSNNPLLIAPGMSLNHLFVAAVVRSETMTYQTALADCSFATRVDPPGNSMHVRELHGRSFAIAAAGTSARVIEIIPGQIVTKAALGRPPCLPCGGAVARAHGILPQFRVTAPTRQGGHGGPPRDIRFSG